MADGELRPIEKIKVGDRARVMDWGALEEIDHEVTSTSKTEPGQSSDTVLYTINGIRVTGMHRFAVGHQAWKRAHELVVGDIVLGPSGERRVIKTVEVGPITEPVFNLRVGTEERTANFFVAAPDGSLLLVSPACSPRPCALPRRPGTSPDFRAPSPAPEASRSSARSAKSTSKLSTFDVGGCGPPQPPKSWAGFSSTAQTMEAPQLSHASRQFVRTD
jgi:hypothetical protein